MPARPRSSGFNSWRLKLSEGNLDKLNRAVELANRDSRHPYAEYDGANLQE